MKKYTNCTNIARNAVNERTQSHGSTCFLLCGSREGTGGHAAQTALFPIADNSFKKLFTWKDNYGPQSPALDPPLARTTPKSPQAFEILKGPEVFKRAFYALFRRKIKLGPQSYWIPRGPSISFMPLISFHINIKRNDFTQVDQLTFMSYSTSFKKVLKNPTLLESNLIYIMQIRV